MMKTKTEIWPPLHDKPLTSKTSNLRPDQEPEVYYFDENLFSKYCELHSEALEFFSNIAADYSTLEIGELTADTMRQISQNKFGEIEKQVNSEIESNLKKLNLTNKVLIDKWREGTAEPLFMFLARTRLDLLKITALRRAHPEIELSTDSYSVKDGAVSFTDADRQKIKTNICTIYIDSDFKRDFLKLSLSALEQLQALKVILLKNGINSLFGSGNLFEQDGDVILNKTIMKFITK